MTKIENMGIDELAKAYSDNRQKIKEIKEDNSRIIAKFDQMSFVQGKNDELYSNDFSIKRYTRVILEFEKISEFIPPENLEKYIIRPAPKVNAIELKKDALRLGGSFLHAYTESIVKESHWWRVAKKKPNKNATNKTTITTPLVPKGNALRAPSINSPPPKPLNINANIVAPTKSAKI